jgi:hypothetical protein
VTSISTLAVPPGGIVVRGVFSSTTPNGSIISASPAPASVSSGLPPAVAITLRTVTARGGKADSLETTSS